MSPFFEKFGFILYYIIVTFFFWTYYSSKYNINLSRIGNINNRFDIPNKGRKFWFVVLVAIVLLMSIPSLIFTSSFNYDWVRIVSQVILISMILYRYAFIGVFFGDQGFYLFDDIIFWDNVKSFSWLRNSTSVLLIINLKSGKTKKINFPKFLETNVDDIFKKYINQSVF